MKNNLTIFLFLTILLLSVLLLSVSHAQTFTGDVTLTTQAEVDAFGANGYQAFEGILNIEESSPGNITSLEPLLSLNFVANLGINKNSALTSLNGLNNITTIGEDLHLEENNQLTNLEGLGNLNSIGSLDLSFNDALINLDGLSSNLSVREGILLQHNTAITNLDGLIGITSLDYISINGQSSLTNIEGLRNLTSVRRIWIEANTLLTNLDGLRNINSMIDKLKIWQNHALANVNGLSNIISIGEYGMSFYYNSSLTNLDGLSNIISVGGELTINGNGALTNLEGLNSLESVSGTLFVSQCESLANINALSNLNTVGGDLKISANWLISNLDGLNNITSVGGDLKVESNISLNNFCGLYPLLNSNGLTGTFNLTGNLSNPTQQDILDDCGSLAVNSKIYLEGAYNSSTSKMNASILTIPLESPYTEDPQSVTSIPTDVVDWVLLELREKNDPSIVVASRSAFLLSTGDIVDLDGFSPVEFAEIAIEYFISVKHRNHLSVMSADKVPTN